MKRINGEALVQTLILAVCALAFAALLITGQIRSYVHPRIEKYAWFAVVALMLMTVSMLPLIRQPKRKNRWLPTFILLVPLLMGFAMPASIGSSSLQLDNPMKPNTPSANSSHTSGLNKNESTTADSGAPSYDVENSDGINVINDDDFLKWCTAASEAPSKYEGKTIKVKGFVYREDGFAANEFVPARMSMVCCAADITACGFMCRSDDAQNWATDSWVWVTATIQLEYDSYYEQDIPVLHAILIESAEKPINELVYPY